MFKPSATAALLLAVPALLPALIGAGAVAQTPRVDKAAFESAAEVTAIDLMVEPAKGSRLRAEDLTVEVGGAPAVVVGVEGVAEERTEPWHFVLYVDTALADSRAVRLAAGMLAKQAAELVARGEVTVVLASREGVREILRADREADGVAEALGRLELEAPGRSELLALRSAYLERRGAASSSPPSEGVPEGVPEAPSAAELGALLAAEERRLLQARLDALLTYLVEPPPNLAERSPSPTARRALFLITSGFDPEPEPFYAASEGEPPSDEAGPDEARLDEPGPIPTLARTLAAYGWSVFSFLPPEEGDGLIPGLRIGKWRVTGPAVGIPGITAVREQMREPEEAEGWMELGRSHLAAGAAGRAEEAFRKALYHFAGDPRTARRQAQAAAGLGRALEAQEKEQEARSAYARAAALDPDLRSELPQAGAAFLAPAAPLEQLAAETLGDVVTEEADLARVLARLDRRRRLTVQLGSAVPAGPLARLTVRASGAAAPLPAAGWVRRGVPASVAEARVRRLLEGALPDGELSVSGELEAASPPPEGEASAEAPPPILSLWIESLPASCLPAPADRKASPPPLRLTLGTLPEGGTEWDLWEAAGTIPGSSDPDSPDPAARLPLERPLPGSGWLAFSLDDPEGGCWGGGVLEWEEAPPPY